jgi:hypothetical protein
MRFENSLIHFEGLWQGYRHFTEGNEENEVIQISTGRCLCNENVFVKIVIKAVVLAVVWAVSTGIGSAEGTTSFWQSIKDPATAAQLRAFVEAKVAQANASTTNMPPEFRSFFAAARRGDWEVVSNLFEYVGEHNSQLGSELPHLPRGTAWDALQEIWGAYAAFAEGNEKYSKLYDSEIIQSIPRGSIYFGGLDPGRFIITALQTSQIKGEPFFTLTQNALTDGTYLDYLRSMYGKDIYIPTGKDSEKCFDDFYAGLKTRLKNHELKPGENATTGTKGELQVNGNTGVMEINALLTKVLFDHETNRQFYVEQSFPLDWMYPYLEPHGLILKLDHEPLNELSDETIRKDNDYWNKIMSPMIGDWLNTNTPVKDVAAFAKRVYLKRDFTGFKGDPEFVQNEYEYGAFSSERSSIADLYLWRVYHHHDAVEWERMIHEADFAYRQAWALCPYTPAVIPNYASLLVWEKKSDDALLVAETAAKFPYYASGNQQREIQEEISWIKQNQKSK